MKVVIIYDSVYGNTASIAKAMGAAIGGEARVSRVRDVDASNLEPADVLVIGSPTLGGRPSQPIQDLLRDLPESLVKGAKVAAFDTRYTGKFVKMFGFAADRIAEHLTSKGALLALPPEAFYVTGKKGPLKDGELERAAVWARRMTT